MCPLLTVQPKLPLKVCFICMSAFHNFHLFFALAGILLLRVSSVRTVVMATFGACRPAPTKPATSQATPSPPTSSKCATECECACGACIAYFMLQGRLKGLCSGPPPPKPPPPKPPPPYPPPPSTPCSHTCSYLRHSTASVLYWDSDSLSQSHRSRLCTAVSYCAATRTL